MPTKSISINDTAAGLYLPLLYSKFKVDIAVNNSQNAFWGVLYLY